MTKNTFSQTCKTYLLVHGAWHGAWSWYKLVPLIEASGNRVIAMDLPGHGTGDLTTAAITLNDYVSEVVAIANAQNGPVILVGHSMAGIVISQAAEELGTGKVSALVYLDAFIPRNGDSLFSLVEMVMQQLPPNTSGQTTLVENIITSTDFKTNTVDPAMAEWLFYHDCSRDDQRFALDRISKQPVAPLATPVQLTDDIYGAIPKHYILCTESNDLNKTLLSTYVPCKKIYHLPSGHCPFLSMPEKLAEILQII